MITKIKGFIKKVNPCEVSDESLTWRILCFIFPDCWCCAGIRGVVIGAALASAVFYFVG